MLEMFLSRYMPCAECGASVERAAVQAHRCSPDRLLDYRLFALRDEIADFDRQLAEFLHGNHGRFHVWLAARDVRRRAA